MIESIEREMNTIINVVEVSEITRYLGIEDVISLFLVCTCIRHRLEGSLHAICSGYSLSVSATSFSHLVSLYDKERVSKRSAPIIGLNRSLARAAAIDSIPLIEMFLSKGATDTAHALEQACATSSQHTIDYLIKYKRDNGGITSWYIETLSFYDRLDLLKQLAFAGYICHPHIHCLVGGARGGHMNIVDYVIKSMSHGSVPIVKLVRYDRDTRYIVCQAMVAAATGGHLEIVKKMMEIGADSYDEAMSAAAKGGHREVVELMIASGATTFIDELSPNIYDENIANMMRDGGIGHYELYVGKRPYVSSQAEDFLDACSDGMLDVVREHLDIGTNVEYGLVQAAIYDHIDIVKIMLDRGATNIDSMISMTKGLGNTSMAKFLESYKERAQLDLTMVLNVVEISEFSRYLDVEDIISLYLTCSSIRNKIESSLSTIYSFSLQPTSFSHLISLYDTERVSRRSAEIIGLNRSFVRAAASGLLPLAQLFLSKGATYILVALEEACENNAQEVVTSLTEYIASRGNVFPYLDVLSYYGYFDEVKTLLGDTHDISYYGLCLESAARGGHMNMVNYLLHHHLDGDKSIASMHTDNPNIYSYVDMAMDAAAGAGHIDIVKIMLDSGSYAYDSAMSEAANGGYIEIVKLMIDKGALVYITSTDMSVTTYHEDISQLMRDYEIIHWEEYRLEGKTTITMKTSPFIEACSKGYLDVVRTHLGTKVPLSIVNIGISTAKEYDHVDIVKLLDSYRG